MNIAIIGCGYIGSMLLTTLIKQGHHVTATVRTHDSLKQVSKYAQKTTILKGSNLEEVSKIVEDSDIIIVTVAARSSDDYENAYLKTAQTIHAAAREANTTKTLIYTSSTSVYGDHQGKWVNETSSLNASTNQAKILVRTEAEYLSLQSLGWKTCILRLSEIYGPGRELSKKIQNLQESKLDGTGDTFTNMIHAEDIVGFIQYAIEHHLSGVFNLSDDEHPLRKDFYETVAKEKSITPPLWDQSLSYRRPNKRVSNHSIKAKGYMLKHSSRVLS